MQSDIQLENSKSIGVNKPQDNSQISATELAATMPGQLHVIKRNGKISNYDESKISVAITKAFLAVEGGASGGIHPYS